MFSFALGFLVGQITLILLVTFLIWQLLLKKVPPRRSRVFSCEASLLNYENNLKGRVA
jgi:hypothetical protein